MESGGADRQLKQKRVNWKGQSSEHGDSWEATAVVLETMWA